MSFIFSCPNCKQELEAEEEWIGMKVECPACKKMIIISKGINVERHENKNDSANRDQDVTKSGLQHKENDNSANQGQEVKKEAVALKNSIVVLLKRTWKTIDALSCKIGEFVNSKTHKQYPPKMVGYGVLGFSLLIVLFVKNLIWSPFYVGDDEMKAIMERDKEVREHIRENREITDRDKEERERGQKELLTKISKSPNTEIMDAVKNNNYEMVVEIVSRIGNKAFAKTDIPKAWDIYCGLKMASNTKGIDERIVQILLDNISLSDINASTANWGNEKPSDVLKQFISQNNIACAKLVAKHGGFNFNEKESRHLAEMWIISLDKAFEDENRIDLDLMDFLLKVCPDARISGDNIVKLLKKHGLEPFKKYLANCYPNPRSNSKWNSSGDFHRQVKKISMDAFDYIVRNGADIDNELLVDIMEGNKKLFFDYLLLANNKEKKLRVDLFVKSIFKNEDTESFSFLLKNGFIKTSDLTNSTRSIPSKCFPILVSYYRDNVFNENTKIKRTGNELHHISELIIKEDDAELMNLFLNNTANIESINLPLFFSSPKSFSCYVRHCRKNNLTIPDAYISKFYRELTTLSTNNDDKKSKDIKDIIDLLPEDDFIYLIKHFDKSEGSNLFIALLKLESWDKAKIAYNSLGVVLKGDYELTNALMGAIKCQRLDAVEFVVDKGANVNKNGFSLKYPLEYAVGLGDYDIVKYLVENGANIRESTAIVSVTTQAFNADQPDIFIYLLKQGGDCTLGMRSDFLTKSIFNFILIAAEQNSYRIAEYFLDQNNNKKYWKDPALLCAFCFAGNIEMVQKCLNNGADVNAFAKSRNIPKKNPNIVTGSDFTDGNRSRFSVGYPTQDDPDNVESYHFYPLPLLSAIANENLDLIQLLVDKGANVNFNIDGKYNNNDNTAFYECPITLAIKMKNKDIIQFLLDHGVDLRKYEKWNFWDMMYNSYYNTSRYGYDPRTGQKEREIQKLLINNGVSCRKTFVISSSLLDALSVLGCDIFTPLDYYTSLGNKEFVSLILEQDKDIPRFRALAIAAMKNNTELMELLYDSGVDLNKKYKIQLATGLPAKETYVLVDAISKDTSAHTVKWLIAHKADVNLRDSKGRTALHQAVDLANTPVVQLLIQSGAKKDIKDKDGKIPADLTNNNQIKLMLSK